MGFWKIFAGTQITRLDPSKYINDAYYVISQTVYFW
jgi:hypothetical protein